MSFDSSTRLLACRKNVKQAISWCLIAIIACSHFIGVSATSKIAEQNKLLEDLDVVLICTGKQFKYISLSTFQQSGKISYVDPPTSSTTEEFNLDCSVSAFFETRDDLATHSGSIFLASLAPNHNVFVNPVESPTLLQRNGVQVRAPPIPV